jgi:hypothetical protein
VLYWQAVKIFFKIPILPRRYLRFSLKIRENLTYLNMNLPLRHEDTNDERRNTLHASRDTSYELRDTRYEIRDTKNYVVSTDFCAENARPIYGPGPLLGSLPPFRSPSAVGRTQHRSPPSARPTFSIPNSTFSSPVRANCALSPEFRQESPR